MHVNGMNESNVNFKKYCSESNPIDSNVMQAFV